MTPQRWARIKEVFGAAYERPKEERSAFLNSACDGDAELRAEVERLLEEGEDSSLHSPASGILHAAVELAPGATQWGTIGSNPDSAKAAWAWFTKLATLAYGAMSP